MLHINDLHYRIEGRPLFEGATVRVPAGHKIGLVGRNGTGKSTLLRLIAEELAPDGGSISLRPGARLGHVMQEIDDTSQSLLDAVLSADTERLALMAEAETTDDPHRIGEIHTRLADINAYDAPARAARILAGLGFSDDDQTKPLSDFSGGWRMRVALAAMLFAEPDMLLLDEPTNYLDLEGVIWLESFLKRYPRTVLIVSHDRDILNATVDGIIHLVDGRLFYYQGGYDQFERQRREHQAQQLAKKTKQDAQRAHMQAFVDRFRAKASKAKQAQSRLIALSKLQPIAEMTDEQTVPFYFPSPRSLAPPLIVFDGAATGYDEEKPILRDIDVRIDPEDRLALLGANGNGKSTFAKFIAGRLPVFAGRRRASKKMVVSYFAQHQIEDLNPRATAYDHLAPLLPDLTEAQLRARLDQYGLSHQKQNTKAEALSGGERVRLVFALMTANPPHLMLLDEPTNHLDVDSREALIHALNEYEGTTVLVSHDRHLVETCADRLFIVADGTVTAYDGSLEDYRKGLLEKDRNKDKSDKPKDEAKARRQEAAKARANLVPLRKEITAIEKDMAVLEREIGLIDKALGNPKLYQESPEKVTRYNKEKALREDKLAELEEVWIEKQTQLEDASA